MNLSIVKRLPKTSSLFEVRLVHQENTNITYKEELKFVGSQRKRSTFLNCFQMHALMLSAQQVSCNTYSACLPYELRACLWILRIPLILLER